MIRLVGVAVAVLVAVSACGVDSTAPEDRVVSLSTTACGHASRTSGAGVIVDDEWVLASAHVVAGAGSVEASGAFGTSTAEIVALDADADLALLRVPDAQGTPVQVEPAGRGDQVVLIGGGPSQSLTATIERPVEVRIEAVRSTERTSRLGYEIDARVALGDSGGGAFNADGALVGIVFGRPLGTGDRSFLVRHEEIERLLAADRSEVWACDANAHRVVPLAG